MILRGYFCSDLENFLKGSQVGQFEEVNFCFINGTLYFLGNCMPEMSIFSTRFEEIFIQLTISHEKHVCKTNIEVKKFF